MKQLKRIWIWCRRIRHLNGFGVQSPFAFSFIHTVIYRKLPKETRKELEGLRRSSPYIIRNPWPGRVERLFYKLARYTEPTFVLYIEKEFSGGLYCISRGSSCPSLGLLEERPGLSNDETSFFKKNMTFPGENMTFLCGNIEERLHEKLHSHAFVDFVYLDLNVTRAHTLCMELLRRCRQDSLLVLGNIHGNKANEMAWKRLTQDPRTALSFDLYSVGLLLFDHHYHRHQYIINFEA